MSGVKQTNKLFFDDFIAFLMKPFWKQNKHSWIVFTISFLQKNAQNLSYVLIFMYIKVFNYEVLFLGILDI